MTRGCGAAQTRFVGMMQYDGDLKLPARFLVPPPAIAGVSGELLANAGISTFACSETQKFGHVRTSINLRCRQPAHLPRTDRWEFFWHAISLVMRCVECVGLWGLHFSAGAVRKRWCNVPAAVSMEWYLIHCGGRCWSMHAFFWMPWGLATSEWGAECVHDQRHWFLHR